MQHILLFAGHAKEGILGNEQQILNERFPEKERTLIPGETWPRNAHDHQKDLRLFRPFIVLLPRLVVGVPKGQLDFTPFAESLRMVPHWRFEYENCECEFKLFTSPRQTSMLNQPLLTD